MSIVPTAVPVLLFLATTGFLSAANVPSTSSFWWWCQNSCPTRTQFYSLSSLWVWPLLNPPVDTSRALEHSQACLVLLQLVSRCVELKCSSWVWFGDMAYIVFCYNCKLFTTVWDWHCIAMCPTHSAATWAVEVLVISSILASKGAPVTQILY